MSRDGRIGSPEQHFACFLSTSQFEFARAYQPELLTTLEFRTPRAFVFSAHRS
jgi:hypothetical protein